MNAQVGRQDANSDSSGRQHWKRLTLSNVREHGGREGTDIRASSLEKEPRMPGRVNDVHILQPATLPLGQLHRETDVRTMEPQADKATQSCALASGSSLVSIKGEPQKRGIVTKCSTKNQLSLMKWV